MSLYVTGDLNSIVSGQVYIGYISIEDAVKKWANETTIAINSVESDNDSKWTPWEKSPKIGSSGEIQ